MSMITVIGRGHSGTRAISHTLSASGVYMGREINSSGDMIPPEDMYDACRVLAKKVKWMGGLNWDFSQVLSGEIDPEFIRLVNSYLDNVLANDSVHKGWKLPETTLAYPWIVQMFPEIRYIFWIRDPRDCILGGHLTDDLHDFGIDYPPTENIREKRAISWKYQMDIVKATPKPKHWIEVRFEDFVLNQDETLKRIEEFLGFKLEKIPVQTAPVGRWKTDNDVHDFEFFQDAMKEYGYL